MFSKSFLENLMLFSSLPNEQPSSSQITLSTTALVYGQQYPSANLHKQVPITHSNNITVRTLHLKIVLPALSVKEMFVPQNGLNSLLVS